MARAHGVSRLRGMRGLGQDDGSDINWGGILSTGIQSAAAVTAVALKPPTYSSSYNAITGQQSVTSYGGVPQTSLFGSSLGPGVGTDLTSLISSPIILLGGLALVAVLVLKR